MSTRRSSYRAKSRKRSYPRKRARARRTGIPRALRGYVRIAGMYGRYQGVAKPELKIFDNIGRLKAIDAASVIPIAGRVDAVLTDDVVDNVGISFGTGVNERIGSRITLRSIFFTGLVYNHSNAVGVQDTIRWWLVLDNQCNGTKPDYDDIFARLTTKDANPVGTLKGDTVATTGLAPLRNPANGKRFRILKEGICNMTHISNNAATNFWVVQKPVKWYMKLSLPIEYQQVTNTAGTGLTAELRETAIWFVTQSTSATADFSWTMRLRYSDA